MKLPSDISPRPVGEKHKNRKRRKYLATQFCGREREVEQSYET